MGLTGLAVLLAAADGLIAEVHCQRTRTRCGVPCRPYGYDDPSTTVRLRTLIGKPPEAVTLLGNSSKAPADIRCKRFVLNGDQIENGPIKISQVGLVLYETGEAACTGLMEHSGGPTGDLRVNRVTIRVRAYGSFIVPPVEGDQNLTGPCLCEWSQAYIVRRGDPIVVNLSGINVRDDLRRSFNEIAQLELDVTVRNSR